MEVIKRFGDKVFARACGYKRANDGIDTRAIQDCLGHVSITHTTKYTALS